VLDNRQPFMNRAGLAPPKLMLKVAFAGKDHCDAVLICTGDYLVIFIEAARLNYGSGAA